MFPLEVGNISYVGGFQKAKKGAIKMVVTNYRIKAVSFSKKLTRFLNNFLMKPLRLFMCNFFFLFSLTLILRRRLCLLVRECLVCYTSTRSVFVCSV